MPLFKDIDLFKLHYPALGSVDWERMSPWVELVEIKVLRNVVMGPTLFNALDTAYQASIAPSPTPMPGPLANLHAKTLKALANLAAYEAIPNLSALFTSGGLMMAKTEGQESAPMWLSNQTRAGAFEAGHVWLDVLISFLVENKATYTDWANAPLRVEIDESLVTTMTTVDRHARILGNAWLLHQLRPAMRGIQNGILKETMGATRLAALLLKVQGTGVLDANDLIMLDLARPAMIYGAIAEEAVPLRLKVDAHTGVYVLEGSTGSSQVSRVEKQATADQLTALARNCKAKSEDFLGQIREIVTPGSSGPALGTTGSVFRS
ncbi:MAG TPA: hypothetical protein PLB89_04710 [Flavobacteriales bacterium]|nr:hypothetical protein [Flavobacteriales bacterium]